MTAKIIALEGPDRVGKNTQATMLARRLRSLGNVVCLHEVPAKDNVTHPVIYWMLRNGLAKRLPRVFQWVQVQNRKILQKKLLEKCKSYDYIILDRWFLSTFIYGTASGIDTSWHEIAHGAMLPDTTIILNGKIGGLEARDVYEQDQVLQARVVRLYRDWAISNPKDSILINATLPREQVHNQIWNHLTLSGLVTRTEKKNEL